MPADRRYAFVTPYYQEDRRLLERCIDSVRAQSGGIVDHFLIADGFPQAWLEDAPVRHLKLDRPHGDFGNTPRGLGALLAICERYDGIGFLDADNWLEREHLELCLAAARRVVGCDYVIARRHLRRPDGTIIRTADEPIAEHVDTSCFFFLPGSYHVVPHFAMMPVQLSSLCDRVFYAAVQRAGLNRAVVAMETVNYHCLWRCIYERAGEIPPPGAKPNIDPQPAQRWLDAQDQRGLEIAGRLAGVSFVQEVAAEASRNVGRNAPCPCGSGRKHKHCHGRRA